MDGKQFEIIPLDGTRLLLRNKTMGDGYKAVLGAGGVTSV